MVEFAKAHSELGKSVTSLPFQPIELTAFYTALNDFGEKMYGVFQPFIAQIAGVIEQIDAIFRLEYGMPMSEYMALQEYFEGQQWNEE